MEDLLKPLIGKRMLLFVPRNEQDLRRDFKELATYPEFRRTSISAQELMFVWFMRNELSPFHGIPDEKKVNDSIELSFPTKQQQETKKEQYKDRNFSDNIKAAFKRMETFNASARMEDYLHIKQVRSNCKTILARDVKSMTPEEQSQYTKDASVAMKLMLETSKTLEMGDFGITEEEDNGGDISGWLTNFRSSIR